jgi:integrase
MNDRAEIGRDTMPKLTEHSIRKIAPPAAGYALHADGNGLALRVTANDARSWVLSYRTKDGRSRRATIGSLEDWTLGAARKRAQEMRRDVDLGGDPVGDEQAERKAETVDELCDRFIAEHLPRKRPTTARGYRTAIELYIRPTLGAMKIKSVTFADADRLHRSITKRGTTYQANRVHRVLSSMFTLAIRWRYRTDNPCRGVEKNREHPRERYLTGAETARLMRELDADRDQVSADLLRLALLTGARRNEIIALKWQDVDLTEGRWTKPHTKAGEKQHVPLNAQACAVLADRYAKDPAIEQPFLRGRKLFSAERAVEHCWGRVRVAANLEGMRMHDLRHSFASTLANRGAGLLVIGKLLGHKRVETTKRYAHLTDDTVRAASEAAGRAIAGLTKPQRPNVVPMRKADRTTPR